MHIPILLHHIKTICSFNNKTYIDLTFGTGKLSSFILQQKVSRLISIDLDISTLGKAIFLEKLYPKNFFYICDNFYNIDFILKKFKISKVDGVIIDLGLSSNQLSLKDIRGFSFAHNYILDMSMNYKTNINSYDFINFLHQNKLKKSICNFCNDLKYNSCANIILKYREYFKIKTTNNLKYIFDIINFSYIFFNLNKIFQFLKISINKDISNIFYALINIPFILNLNGYAIILTFNSIEDQIIKDYFNIISLLSFNFAKTYKIFFYSHNNENIINNNSYFVKCRIIKRIK